MGSLKEVCMRFPAAAFHTQSLLCAVGRGPGNDEKDAAADPVSVYDLHTGAKKRALRFRRAFPSWAWKLKIGKTR